MKFYRCLVWVGVILLSVVCLASCDGEAHTYARDAWFSENVLNDCALPAMPTPAEGISYVKEDENSIYLNLSRKEYIAYIESLYEAVLAEDFAFMGAVKDAKTNIFGKTTYRTRMANLFYEFFIGESGENEEFCILFGNEEPQNGRVSGTRVHVWWSESVVAPVGDDNFPYNTKITICRTADQPREQYTIAQYQITYEAAPDGTSTLTGKSVAYEGQNVEVAGTYEGETWHHNLYLNQQKLGCSRQSSSRGGHHSIRLRTDFSMPGEDVTISWVGENVSHTRGTTTVDRVETWLNGLEAQDVLYIGKSSNSYGGCGISRIPVGYITKVGDPAVIARILAAWKREEVIVSEGDEAIPAGGSGPSSITLHLKDGTAKSLSIHRGAGDLFGYASARGNGVSYLVHNFHSYTAEEMEAYHYFACADIFGSKTPKSISIVQYKDGELVETQSFYGSEEVIATMSGVKMQQVEKDAIDPEMQPLYRIKDQAHFDIYVFSDTLIGLCEEETDYYYNFYEITAGATMDEIIALLLALAEQS